MFLQDFLVGYIIGLLPIISITKNRSNKFLSIPIAYGILYAILQRCNNLCMIVILYLIYGKYISNYIENWLDILIIMYILQNLLYKYPIIVVMILLVVLTGRKENFYSAIPFRLRPYVMLPNGQYIGAQLFKWALI